MSPIRFAIAVSIATLASCLAPPAGAAVMILEGTEPPPSNPPAQAAPSAPARTEEPPAPPSPPVLQPPAKAAIPDAPAAPPPTPSVATDTPNLADLANVTPGNEAHLSVEMLPGQTVSVGAFVSFKVTSKKPGYVMLMDVDAAGHLNQIYPSTPALTRAGRVNGNYIKPGSPMLIPPTAGMRFVVSPPQGQAMIIGILSASPVQIVDLPDIPAEILGKPDMILAYLSKRTNELRIPDQDNKLRQAQWSFDAKPYVIQ
jgi:hypothetical protein